jgi:hypothetical protein
VHKVKRSWSTLKVRADGKTCLAVCLKTVRTKQKAIKSSSFKAFHKRQKTLVSFGTLQNRLISPLILKLNLRRRSIKNKRLNCKKKLIEIFGHLLVILVRYRTFIEKD